MTTQADLAQTDLAIEATGIAKSFGATQAVAGIDLVVPVGAIYGVLGPNGAGKTTRIRMLATLIEPDTGRARVLGHDAVAEAGAGAGRRAPPPGPRRCGEAAGLAGLIPLTGEVASVDEDLTGRETLVLLGRLLGLR